MPVVSLDAGAQSPPAAPQATPRSPVPPSRETTNVYAETGIDAMSPAAANALPRVYVPNVSDNSIVVIDPATMKVVDRYQVPGNPQHVVPSWDLKTLWIASSAPSRNISGAVTPLDPTTGKAGKPVVVRDAYNLYFLPDGSAAVVVAEMMAALEFRDPQTMKLISTLDISDCDGINHADFAIDGSFAIFTCEFGGGGLVKVDLNARKVAGRLKFSKPAMPQDIRSSPDGSIFFVADMLADGVHLIDTRPVQVRGLHSDRDGRPLAVPQPRRQEALRRQPRVAQHAGEPARSRGRCRCSTSPRGRSRPTGRSPAAAARTWATSAPTERRCGCRDGTTTSSMRSILPAAP